MKIIHTLLALSIFAATTMAYAKTTKTIEVTATVLPTLDIIAADNTELQKISITHKRGTGFEPYSKLVRFTGNEYNKGVIITLTKQLLLTETNSTTNNASLAVTLGSKKLEAGAPVTILANELFNADHARDIELKIAEKTVGATATLAPGNYSGDLVLLIEQATA